MNKSCLVSILPMFYFDSGVSQSENSKSPANNRQGSTALCAKKLFGVSKEDQEDSDADHKQRLRAESMQRPPTNHTARGPAHFWPFP